MSADVVENLRIELEKALDAVDKAEEVAYDAGDVEKVTVKIVQNCEGCDDKEHLKSEFVKLRIEIDLLIREKSSLTSELDAERRKNEVSQQNLSELESISGRLQSEVLKMDADKIRLSDMEENEVLGKVMEKISEDYDDLKKLFDQQAKQQQMRPDQKDDKIRALRNTARALENENELLSKERESLEAEVRSSRKSLSDENSKIKTAEDRIADLANELGAKNSERSQLLEMFGRLESEKINVLRQLSIVQTELDVAEARVRELESAEATLKTLSAESSVAEIGYETKIIEVQREMEARLEEINSVQEHEVDSVKTRYVTLFNEKAEELHALREVHSKTNGELKEAKAKVSDLEYREEELQGLLGKSRSGSMDAELKEKSVEVEAEVVALRAHAVKVEEEVEAAREQYDRLQESYRNSVGLLQTRLCEITRLLHAKEEAGDDEEQGEERVVEQVQSAVHTESVIESSHDIKYSQEHSTDNPESVPESSHDIKYSQEQQQNANQQSAFGSGKRRKGRKKNRKRSVVRT